MKHSRSYGLIRRAATATAAALLVVSCNGTGINLAGGGIGGTGVTAVSVGPITQFGSIFVNGVEHDLTHATIMVNGSPVTGAGDGNQLAAQYLALGQVVRVDGVINANGLTGTATTVTFSNDVKGPITAITDISAAHDMSVAQITVLGQTIIVDDATTHIFRATYHDGTLAIAPDLQQAMQQGTLVEVSGLTNNNGDIHATSVEIDDGTGGSGTYDLKGTVSNLDTNARTFTIHGQTVDYSAVTGIVDSQLAGGPYVEVKGYEQAGILLAQTIKLESRSLGGDVQRAEIEGFVTSAIDANEQFDLDGQTVAIVTSGANATTYENGTVADVVPGAKLEVEGGLKNGILTAAKIKIKTGSQD